MDFINSPVFIERENDYQETDNPSINIYILNPSAFFYNNANSYQNSIPSMMVQNPYCCFNNDSNFQVQMTQQQMIQQQMIQQQLIQQQMIQQQMFQQSKFPQQQIFPNFCLQPTYQSMKTSKSSKKVKSGKKKKTTKKFKPSKQSKSTKESTKKEKRSKTSDKYTEISCPNGIFKYYFDTHHQNPITKDIIGIEGNSLNPSWVKELPNIIDPKFKRYWLPQHVEDSYFKIDFKTSSIKIDKYHVFLGNGSGMFIFKNWIIYGTTEDGREIVLSEVNDCPEIEKRHPEATIKVDSKEFVRSIKFVFKGRNESGVLSMDFRNIELYGVLKQKVE